MKILDMECARFGYKMAGEFQEEAPVNKSLGVLQEDGIYAFFLHLNAKKLGQVSKIAFELLKQDFALKDLLKDDGTDALAFVRDNLAEDIDQLLFAKALLERTLVYARYHVKSMKKEAKR